MKSDPVERGRRANLVEQSAKRQLGLAPVAAFVVFPPTLVFAGLSAAFGKDTLALGLGDPGIVIASLLGIVAMIAMNAIFVSGETSLNQIRLNLTREAEEPDSPKWQIEKKENVVAACVLGAITCRSFLIFFCLTMSPVVLKWMGFFSDDVPVPEALSKSLLATMLLAIPVMFCNVVVELVAKTYATEHPVAASERFKRVLRFVDIVFRLPATAAGSIASVFARKYGSSASFSADTSRAEEEIKEILDSSEGTGEIEESERELLQSVFEFGDMTASKVMTPRVDIESIPIDTDLKTLATLVEATGHSRFPVYEGTDDTIVGIIHAKDVLRAMARGQESAELRDLIRPAMFITENKPLHDLLAEMRAHQAQMVIVQDEFAGTAGLVTIEDIVEELIGDIVDEYDVADPEFVTKGDTHLVSGKFHLDELNDQIGTEFESDEFDTVGGFLFGLFGRQPKEGEYLDYDGYRFTVENSDGRRIERVRIEPAVEDAAEHV